MNRIGFFVNESKDPNLEKTKVLENFVRDKGIAVETIIDPYNMDIPEVRWEISSFFDRCDCVITIGGDGTLLDSAKYACQYRTKLLGINAGHVGFLTDWTVDNAQLAITNLIKGYYHVEKHMMLEITLNNNEIEKVFALNDAIIIKRDYTVSTIRIKLYLNNYFMNEYTADGICVATPTGSTAYNLSLKGPVLYGTSKMMVITPVACHSLSAPPFVVGSDDLIKLEITSNLGDAHFLLDGKPYSKHIKTVEIKAANIFTEIIRAVPPNPFKTLKQKLN